MLKGKWNVLVSHVQIASSCAPNIAALFMRNNMTDGEAWSYDQAIQDAWSSVLGRSVPDGPLLKLPGKFSGVGLTCARDRHNAAIWTAWQSALDDAPQACGHGSAEDMLDECPNLADLDAGGNPQLFSASGLQNFTNGIGESQFYDF